MEAIFLIVLAMIVVVALVNNINEKRAIKKIAKEVVTEHLKMKAYADSFKLPPNDKPVVAPSLGKDSVKQGARICSVCGKSWSSTMAQFKDSGLLGNIITGGGSLNTTYTPENLVGVTCQKCGRSFCKDHLGQPFPSHIPGGSCPICQGILGLV